MDGNFGMQTEFPPTSQTGLISLPPFVSDATSGWTIGARGGSCSRTGLVADESEWRLRPLDAAWASSDPKVIATRWVGYEDHTRDTHSATGGDGHVVKIVLRNMNCCFSVAGRTVRDGFAGAGTVHITEPGASSRCLFRGPYDTMHLHVPNSVIAECGQGMAKGNRTTLRCTPTLICDPTIERLARIMLDAEEVDTSHGSLFLDNIGIAIVTRLLASAHGVSSPVQPGSGLAKWRLKRALEFVETHLAEPIRLGEIAAASGLSRMHFAAQFKIATGLRPHEYLIRRRIERAQEMLVAGNAPLVDIALSLGFQTQAHFTTVFRRFVGRPPRDWRRSLA